MNLINFIITFGLALTSFYAGISPFHTLTINYLFFLSLKIPNKDLISSLYISFSYLYFL